MTDCCTSSHPEVINKAALSVALVGNPNCGKTTLFNALTGAHQKVGNWPGVTVERKSGRFNARSTTVEVIDLPGVYSLAVGSAEGAIDERIACEFILNRSADVIVNIVDASNLERHLYLTIQLLEMGVPLILALNMMDVAKSRNIHINVKELSQQLGCPVVTLEAKKGDGVNELKQAIVAYQAHALKPLEIPYHQTIKTSLNMINVLIEHRQPKLSMPWLPLRLLENDVFSQGLVDSAILVEVLANQEYIQQMLNEDTDILIADARYRFIEQLTKQCVTCKVMTKTTWTSRIDNIVLNRILGIPIFLGVMYVLFFVAINIGGAFQDFFDISSQTIFVDGFAYYLTQFNVPAWVTAILANGVGKGINTTVTFIPVLGSMFLFLALLEDSGYMARAAFVIDRFMRSLGLPGKAFVPMIVGFGCNVPAIMGARTLENKRDRILTIMMSPFMSCSARLAIYAVFIAAFFPQGGQNLVFLLYLIGIAMAILTGFILRKTLLQGDPSPLVMELPLYHSPHWKTLLLHAWQRLKGFVFRAGKLIIPICVLIGALNTLNTDGTMNTGEGDAHSLLSVLGQWLTPLFAPMGIHENNWPATVGLVTGILAKEVVIGTLNTLYTQMGHLNAVGNVDAFSISAGLQAAWQSIPDNFIHLKTVLSNPLSALTGGGEAVNKGVYGLMYQQFDGKVGAFTYLLFVLLYFPCISTTAVMLREIHRGWSFFSIFWMTSVAYAVAVCFYQLATWMKHPLTSTLWIIMLCTLFFVTLFSIRFFAAREARFVKRMNTLPAGESI